MMSLKKIIALGIGLLIIWLLGISLLRQNLGSKIRLFNDIYDKSDYAYRGEWVLHGQIPYRDTFSEYPQVSTYLFAVPYLLQSQRMKAEARTTLYGSTFSFLMFGVLFATILLLYRMLPKRKELAFLLLLPAGIYFSFNRFDILPSFLVLLALMFLQRKQTILVGVVLGVATLTKWYPALLLPVILTYLHLINRHFDWKLLLAFCLTCLLIVLPTLLLGGINALLQPYIFHVDRSVESVSLAGLVQSIFIRWFGATSTPSILILIFLALSILPVPFSLVTRIDTFEKVVNWSVLIVGTFMVFSRIYSPQWILWLMPLLILSARKQADIIWIVIYDLWTYLSFPVVFDLVVTQPAGPIAKWLQLVALIGLAILIRMVAVALKRADIRFSLNLSGFRKALSKNGA